MSGIKETLSLIKVTLLESLQEATKKFLRHIFSVAMLIIAVLVVWVLWVLWGSVIMLLTYEVPIFLLMVAVLLSSIVSVKIHSARKLAEKIQTTYCEITSDGNIDNPKITMIQRFVNMSELPLELSKVEIKMVADGIEIGKSLYSQPNHTIDFGDKITASENGAFSPLNLDCWIECEIGDMQRVSKFQGKEIEVRVKGLIEFATKTKRIDKVIDEKKEIAFKKPTQVIGPGKILG